MKVYVVTSMLADIANDVCSQCVEGVFDSEEKAAECRTEVLNDALMDTFTSQTQDDLVEEDHRIWIADQDRLFEVMLSEREME